MTDAVSSGEPSKRKRVRSPAYPALSLKEAIERARQLHDEIHHHPAPVEVINQAWGYKEAGSTGPLYLAALRRYGLVQEIEGSDPKQFKITDSARKILLAPSDDVGLTTSLIKEAALKPKIFRELWTHFNGEIPNDSMLRYHLVAAMNFNKDAVANFIRMFRDTIAFAKLRPGDKSEGGDILSPDIEDDGDERDTNGAISSTKPLASSSAKEPISPTPVESRASPKMLSSGPSNQQEFTLPVPNGGILIRGPFPLSEADFETFKKAIDLFKPWLVKSDSSLGYAQSEREQ